MDFGLLLVMALFIFIFVGLLGFCLWGLSLFMYWLTGDIWERHWKIK